MANDPNAYDAQFDAAGKKYDVDPRLLKTIYQMESSSNPNTMDSSQGAQGGMQLMPETARILGVKNPRDMTEAIPAAARYLKQGLDKYGTPDLALAYYFAGPDTSIWGPKTANYVATGQRLFPTTQIKATQPAATSPQSFDETDVAKDLMAQAKPQTATSTPAAPSSVPLSFDDTDVAKDRTVTQKAAPGVPQSFYDTDVAKDLGLTAPPATAQSAQPTTAQPTSTQAPSPSPVANGSDPNDASTAFGAGFKNAIGGLVAPIGTAISAGTRYLASKIPDSIENTSVPGLNMTLGDIDKLYGSDIGARIGQANTAADEKYAPVSPLAYGAGKVAGNIVGTLPVTAGLGAVATPVVGPVLSGAAQGAAAASLTGGNPYYGAVGGGVLGAGGAALQGLGAIGRKLTGTATPVAETVAPTVTSAAEGPLPSSFTDSPFANTFSSTGQRRLVNGQYGETIPPGPSTPNPYLPKGTPPPPEIPAAPSITDKVGQAAWQSAIAKSGDWVVKHGMALAGFSQYGIGGYIAATAVAPVIGYIAKQYGPAVAQAAGAALKSSVATGTAGMTAGAIGPGLVANTLGYPQ